jgi:ribosomal protein L22
MMRIIVILNIRKRALNKARIILKRVRPRKKKTAKRDLMMKILPEKTSENFVVHELLQKIFQYTFSEVVMCAFGNAL